MSAEDQAVRVAGETLRFAAGDRIHTENSYKYDVEEVLALAAPAWRPLHQWIHRAFYDEGRGRIELKHARVHLRLEANAR